MDLTQIKDAIDDIQHEILIHSLAKKPMEQLQSLSEQVDSLKGKFLNATFIQTEVEVLEGIRFGLQECRLNLEIEMKELRGLDISMELEQLAMLYQSAMTN